VATGPDTIAHAAIYWVPSLRSAGNRDNLPATCIMGAHYYRIWIGRRCAHSVLRPHLTAVILSRLQIMPGRRAFLRRRHVFAAAVTEVVIG
jgi:hypothetical protein